MTTKTYNVGVVGYGMSAKVFHIPLILVTSAFKLHSIVQRSPTSVNSAQKDHPEAKVYASTESMFADPAVDIIVVTSTPETHFQITSDALRAGKHVLVEKPFVPSSAEATSLIELAAQSKRLLCVYQNRRWDSDFLTIQSLLSEGTIGRVVEFESHFDRYKAEKPTNWKGALGMKQGGGIIYDLGTHLIDQIVVALGMPVSVTGFLVDQRGEGDGAEPDGFTVVMRYHGGIVATAKGSVMSVETEQLRFWIRGTKGSYRKFHLDCQEDQLKAGLKPGDAGFGIEEKQKAGLLTVLGANGPERSVLGNVKPETYASLYAEFANAIETGNPDLVPVKASEARDVLRIIEAARQSAETGQFVKL